MVFILLELVRYMFFFNDVRLFLDVQFSAVGVMIGLCWYIRFLPHVRCYWYFS